MMKGQSRFSSSSAQHLFCMRFISRQFVVHALQDERFGLHSQPMRLLYNRKDDGTNTDLDQLIEKFQEGEYDEEISNFFGLGGYVGTKLAMCVQFVDGCIAQCKAEQPKAFMQNIKYNEALWKTIIRPVLTRGADIKDDDEVLVAEGKGDPSANDHEAALAGVGWRLLTADSARDNVVEIIQAKYQELADEYASHFPEHEAKVSAHITTHASLHAMLHSIEYTHSCLYSRSSCV